ncbi:hypothetical protein [Williamsoniiplasma lucivorax]|uniref:Lipoprotein n=1 Tax=Williamsoniiplasma lucivorax TaxID=209274 RepID=A0A2S5RF01_9MOLU|nr:hypothetical protein [Williamsoniiplasma lucivorax]PPE05867.1 hypothetical protein ELUCI_v1c01550 [Williamsoniiplasma lucivorax]
MKKLIAILMGVTVSSSSVMAVVSCATIPKHEVPVLFEGAPTIPGTEDAGAWKDYSKDDKIAAFDSGFSKATKQAYGFPWIIMQLRNLLSVTGAAMNNPNQFNKHNNFLIGDDQGVQGAAVHGIWKNEDSEIQGKDKREFFNKFEKTQIASIAGLWDLYNESKHGFTPTATGAQASLEIAKEAFGSEDGQVFAKNFLGLNEDKQDSSWLEQKITIDGNTKFLNSDVLTVISNDGKLENEDSGTKSFKEANDKTDPPKERTKKVGQDVLNPFSQFIFSSGNLPTPSIVVKDPESNSKADETPPKSGAIILENYKEGEKNKWEIKKDQFLIGEATPITINYKFTLDAKNDNADKYDVKTTFEGLRPVYRAIAAEANNKENTDNKKLNFVKWTFAGYQFNDFNFIKDGNKDFGKTSKPGEGAFSKIKLTKLEIKKEVK